MKKVLIVVSEGWYFVSHRLPLAIDATRAGFDVVIVGRYGNERRKIEDYGLRTIVFEMDRRGLNPFVIVREAVALARIFRYEKPDVVHLVALRPVVIGGLASRVIGLKSIVFAVTGMGFLFTDGGRLPWIRKMVQLLLPRLMSHGLTIVQNHDDAKQLIDYGLLKSRLRIIPGAGVDITRFRPRLKEATQPPVIMMASRLLRDKGVVEFVEAARHLRNQGRFVLVGAIDLDNPAAISKVEMTQWVESGFVEWWGYSNEMAHTLSAADIVCLPSYREGFPKVLLEAMACGKPCITTDVPGCREAGSHEENGLLVPVKNIHVLISAIERLIEEPQTRLRMGECGR